MLAETLEAKGSHEQSLQHWKIAWSIKEDMLGPQKQKAIAEILIRSSTEKLENERTRLRKDVRLKSQEIERLTMHLMEKNESMRIINRRVKEIAKLTDKKIGIAHSKLSELLSTVNYSLDEKKKVVPYEFQLVYREVLQKFSKEYPTLTPNQYKICVLLRNGLSTKQIADTLKISIRTVDWHRNRIRKEMKLERKASLTMTLAGI